MRKSEIQKLKAKFEEGSVLSSKTLNDFIDKEFVFSRPDGRRFAIFDLTRENVLYQLNADLYKLSSRKQFQFVFPVEMAEILLDLGRTYPELELCSWETMSLNKLLEMQMLKNIIFVEIEKGFETLVLEQITKIERFTVLLKPEISLIDAYINSSPLVIIKPLTYKAPTSKKRFSNRVGFNMSYHGDRSSLSTPKVEKIIVDLFADPTLQIIDNSQKTLIIKNILRDYVVNFKTLLSYARNRNKKEFMLDYLKNEIRFDIDVGEFYD